MLRENNRTLRKVHLSVDLAVTLLSFAAAYAVRGSVLSAAPLKPFSEYAYLLLFIIPLWWALFVRYGMYDTIRLRTFSQTLMPVVKTVFSGTLMLMALLFLFKLHTVSRGLIVTFLVINFAFLFAARVALYLTVHFIRKRGYNYRSVLIIGTGKRAEEFARVLNNHREWGVRIAGFVDYEPGRQASAGVEVIGDITRLEEILTGMQIDEVVFVVPRRSLNDIEEQIILCEKLGIKASISADFYPHTIAVPRIEQLEGWPLLVFATNPRLENAFFLKRALDLATAMAVLVLSAPVFAAAVAGVKMSSPGPVFFRQVRCGRNGRRFDLLKFRTMVADAESLKSSLTHLNEMSGPVFKIKSDPRITRFGRLLRKYSIDELPQLINVLKGDMSIVGPRPPLPAEVEKYDVWQRRRLSVQPGLTCLWQVNGRNKIGFDEWMKQDLYYIDNWSFVQDLKIMLKTIPAVLKGTGS